MVYYQDKIKAAHQKIVGKCKFCGGEGLIIDSAVRFKLGRPTDDIKQYLSSIAQERKECKCMSVFKHVITCIEANLPDDLWNINRAFVEDVKVRDTANNRSLSIKKIIEGYVKNIDAALDSGVGFLFFGPNGTGKTFFGCKILMSALKFKYSAHYMFFVDFVEMLKDFDNDFVYRVIDEIMDVDFLFMDEIGKEYKISQFVKTNFEKLLKQRLSKRKPIIFATNLDYNQLSSFYGPSVISVISNINLMLSFDKIPDMRSRRYKTKVNKFFEEL